MNNKIKPALIGGVVVGILSVIPFVSLVNVCCCLWAILGGMLGSYLYVKNSPTPATAGDGAIVGVLVGLIGAAIAIVLGVPIGLAMGSTMRGLLLSLIESIDPGQVEMFRAQMEASQTITRAIVNSIIAAVFLFIFSIIGGLIGIPLFEKRKGNLTPPPPPNIGGVGGGYAA
jgi:hypothetical protein